MRGFPTAATRRCLRAAADTMHVDGTQLVGCLLLIMAAIAGGTFTAAQTILDNADKSSSIASEMISTPTAVIFELSDEGQQYAASAAIVSASPSHSRGTAAAAAAAVAAATEAASFGATPAKQQQISQLVAAAADAAPGIAAVSSSLAGQATQSGIAIIHQAEVITSVLQGAVLTAGSSSDALKLTQLLEQSTLVKSVWRAVRGQTAEKIAEKSCVIGCVMMLPTAEAIGLHTV
jgi:hypothetical protein